MGIIQNVLLWHFPLVILRFERSFFSGITSLFLSCSMPSFEQEGRSDQPFQQLLALSFAVARTLFEGA